MYGGLLKSASALAIVAAAGLFGISSAKAADLGGDCCADLEERVAELEATTARKGNRKVSLVISGQISTQLMFWDDGIKSDVYVSGPTQSNSRWRMTGTAKISPEVTAGFLYEFEAFASQSSSQNQLIGNGMTVNGTSGDDNGGSGHSLREMMAWVEHSRLGRVSMGHGSTAANNAILVDLSGKGMAASNDVRLHSSGMYIAFGVGGGVHSNLTWGNLFNGASGDWLNERNEHIQYRTPTVAGFSFGASVGDAWVFPGGVVDAGDRQLAVACRGDDANGDAAYAITATGERFEECGSPYATDAQGRALDAWTLAPWQSRASR